MSTISKHVCIICFEEILLRSTLFMTTCNHCYHKQCMFAYMETYWANNYLHPLKCPLCRRCLGHPQLYDNPTNNNSTTNGLDELEDFWNSYRYRLPIYCSNQYNHYLGMMNDCLCCEAYREKGEFIYEIR